MKKLPYRVTLSEALSWLAFGVLCDKDKLKSELVSSAFGFSIKDADAKLAESLVALLEQAHAQKITLEGKWVEDPTSSIALTAKIDSTELANYRAFDMLVDGLLQGEGILWISNKNRAGKMVWVNNPKTSIESYGDITMDFKELRHCLKAGSSPKLSSANNMSPISPTALQKWWQGLSTAERTLSQVQLLDLCKKSHPDHRITRQKIRDLTGSRKTGPKPIRPEKFGAITA